MKKIYHSDWIIPTSTEQDNMMFRLILLVEISILSSVIKQSQCQVWPGISMTIPSAYQGAHLNRMISTGAGPRSAIDDIRGLSLFDGMGPSANVNRMPNPDTIRQMLMMQMMGAMNLLTGMALDDAPPIHMSGMPMAHGNGMMNIMSGMAAPTRNRGIVVDDAPVRHGTMGGLFSEREGGGMPWTSGMQRSASKSAKPWTSNMPMAAAINGMPAAGGMQMGAGINGMPAGGGMSMSAGINGVPAAGGMQMSAGINGMPAGGGMSMGAGINGMPAGSGMPMGAGINGMPAGGGMSMGAGINGMPAGSGMPMGAGINGMPVGGGMSMGAGINGMPAGGGMSMGAGSNLPPYTNMSVMNIIEMLRGIGSMGPSAKAKQLMSILDEAPVIPASGTVAVETTTSSNSVTTTPKDL